MTRRIPPHIKATSGIESILLQPTPDLIEKLQDRARIEGEEWQPPGENQSGKKSYEPSVMILDTFFSDSSDQIIINKICQSEKAFPSIQILLVNPNSDFALRQPFVMRGVDTPDAILLRGLWNIADALEIDREETRKEEWENIEKCINRTVRLIQEAGEGRKLELRFYDVYPRNPMYFFNDILVSGQFGVVKDCLELPWYKIIDDPVCDQDLYDEYREEFAYIWDNSSPSIEDTISQDLNSHQVDVAIICALEEELDAVLKMGDLNRDQWERVNFIEHNSSIFHNIQVESINNNSISVIAGRKATEEMGSTVSASLTTEIIHRFQPKLILLVGIAAGSNSDKQIIGDILIAKKVVDYDSGKLTDEGFLNDSNSIDINQHLLGLFNEVSDYDASLNRIHKQASITYSSAMKNTRRINIHPGSLLCGSKVIASDKKIQEFKINNRKYIGLEMESYGVYYAARNSSLNSPYFLTIKSISDFANEEKNDYGRNIALFTAAEFCYEFIVNRIETLLSE